MTRPETQFDPLALIAWSRIWSPVVPVELFENAWQVLEIPLDPEQYQSAVISTFHAGNPGPVVPLLLHAALGLDGGDCREVFIRIMEHLELDWQHQRLPPDHLALACELLACAHEQEETVLIDGLKERFLRPWCETARARIPADDPVQTLPELFAEALH